MGLTSQLTISDPWFGWLNDFDTNAYAAQNNLIGLNLNHGESADLGSKDDGKTNTALLDARLKVIEARLKITKMDPDEVIEISDGEGEESELDFNPKTSSTRIKEEKEE